MAGILQRSAFGRSAGRQLPFSTRFSGLGEVPPAFKKTLDRMLEGREDHVRHIIFTPEFGTFGEYCPATLFVVTNREWLALSSETAGAPSVRYSDFDHTRMVETTLALLEGRLVLEFGSAGESACVLRFSLTSWDLFRDALCGVLSNGRTFSAELSERPLPQECEKLSFGMRSTLQESIMPDDQIERVIAWTRADVPGGSAHDSLHPGGIVLTKNFLCVVTADDPSDRNGPVDLAVYNRGVVFLSRRFPISGRVVSEGLTDRIELAVGSGAEASTVTVLIPQTFREPADALLGRLSESSMG